MNQREAFIDTMLLGHDHGWAEQHTNPDLRYSHAEDMLRRWREECSASPAKQGRWLGWLQGSLCAMGFLTLDEAKAINMAHRDEPGTPPDYVYDPDDWRGTYQWEDRSEIIDRTDATLNPVDKIKRFGTFLKGPTVWAARIAVSRDEEIEIRWFFSEAEARAAAASPSPLVGEGRGGGSPAGDAAHG